MRILDGNARRKVRTTKIVLLLLALIVAAAMLATGCLRAPAETGAVTNTEGVEATPEQTQPTDTSNEQTSDENESSESDGSASTQTNEETTNTVESAEPKKDPRPSESSITIELEGMQEQITVSLNMSELGYSMYYDTARYQIVETSSRFDADIGVDEYMPVTPAEALPDVYMQVGHSIDTGAADMLTTLSAQAEEKLSAQAREAEAVTIGVDKLPGQRVRVISGQEWDSEIIDIIVFDDGRDGSFFICGGFFLEAEEGHGSRFTQMLDTFRIE